MSDQLAGETTTPPTSNTDGDPVPYPLPLPKTPGRPRKGGLAGKELEAQKLILAKAGYDNIKQLPKRVLKAVDTLGLSKQRWSNIALRAQQELGQWMTMKVTLRILAVRDFDSLDQIDYAYKVAREIADNTALSAEERINGLRIIAMCAESHTKLSTQIVQFIEKLEQKDPASDKPKNLPPTVPVQINIDARKAGVTQVPAIAKSDAEQEPENNGE